jgi:hypothetical protein
MKLGGIAATLDDSLFFWKQAGLTEDAILSAAGKIEAERIREMPLQIAANKGLAVAPLPESPEAVAMGDLVLPIRYVSSVASARYMIVNEEFTRRVTLPGSTLGRAPDWLGGAQEISYTCGDLQNGDVLLLDVSKNDSVDLSPFWNRIVAVHFRTRLAGLGPSIYVGQLLCISGVPGVTASLCIWLGDDVERYDLGVWRPPLAGGDLITRRDSQLRQNTMQAEKELRLDADYRIVGLVTGWLKAAPPGQK